MISIEHNGQIVRQSKNLRGILDYSLVSPVVRVETIHLPNGAGSARVFFENGATSRANFASYEVMRYWFNSRRNWTFQQFDN